MKSAAHICRLILGLLFVFSGFVKGIDPLGLTYKITDYLEAFNLFDLEFLAFPLSILLSFAEFAVGMGLLSGVLAPLFSSLVLLFMLFFTALTFYIALYNPVSDCGCFGDALKLSNWQTFYKNIVFTAAALVLYTSRKKMKFYLNCTIRIVVLVVGLLAMAGSIFYSYQHLPIFDFRAFKEGVNITKAMTIPEDAPTDVYENTFYYKNTKTGDIKRFTDEDYPWQDTLNWTYDHMEEPKLIRAGYVAPIQDFFVETPEGDNVADYFLEEDNFTFFWIAYRLDKANETNMENTVAMSEWASENGYNFIGLTSSSVDEISEFKTEHSIEFDILQSDEISLKTIIRSNPGLMVTYRGTILKKYHYNDIPGIERFKSDVFPGLNSVSQE